MWSHVPEGIKHFLDVTSIGVAVAAFVKVLPEVTVVLSFVWICLRTYSAWLEVRLKQKQLNDSE